MSDLPTIKTRVAGVSFENRDGTPRQPFVKQAKKGDRLTFRREPDNPYDPNAIAVEWSDAGGDRHQIGYVPRTLAQLLAPMADEGAFFHADVVMRGRAKPAPGRPPLYGVRMAISGDLSGLPAHWRNGLEPAIELALEQDKEAEARELEMAQSLAPTLGGRAG